MCDRRDTRDSGLGSFQSWLGAGAGTNSQHGTWNQGGFPRRATVRATRRTVSGVKHHHPDAFQRHSSSRPQSVRRRTNLGSKVTQQAPSSRDTTAYSTSFYFISQRAIPLAPSVRSHGSLPLGTGMRRIQPWARVRKCGASRLGPNKTAVQHTSCPLPSGWTVKIRLDAAGAGESRDRQVACVCVCQTAECPPRGTSPYRSGSALL